MGRYFGTDGIRGKANVSLNVERAFLVGRFLGYHFSKSQKGKMLIGKDTRLSSDMFEMAIASGATASGCDVYLLGYCPTPCVAHLTAQEDFGCGVMISASHNPYYDNGIKVFNHDGVKLASSIEGQVEDFIDGLIQLELTTDQMIGKVYGYTEGLEHYLTQLKSLFNFDLTGYKIAMDLANGSATTTAEQFLTSMGAQCSVIHGEPNGININTHCGSTHPQDLQTLMRQGDYDLGLAFDGDADRLIAVDHKGELIDGDKMLYICGCYLKQKNQLSSNTLVTTVMANLGLFKALDRAEIAYKSTQVGDKYVYECMTQNNYVLGGEQSGHIIFSKHETTGDGLLSALMLLEVMVNTKKTIPELSADLFIFPQLLVNVAVHDKQKALINQELLDASEAISQALGNEGRILVRPSGTEPLIRVMVEAKTDELCKHYVDSMVALIKSKNL